MSRTYLSSRVEVLKALFVETGRRVALINTPKEFNEWIDNGLPEDTDYLDTVQDRTDVKAYDIILLWGLGNDGFGIEQLMETMDPESDLWAVVRVNDKEADRYRKEFKFIDHVPGSVPLTLDLEIIPISLGMKR
jgi:hypothetical protein